MPASVASVAKIGTWAASAAAVWAAALLNPVSKEVNDTLRRKLDAADTMLRAMPLRDPDNPVRRCGWEQASIFCTFLQMAEAAFGKDAFAQLLQVNAGDLRV